MIKILISIIVIAVLVIVFVPQAKIAGEGLLAQIVGFFNKLWQERKPAVIKEFKKETKEMAGDIMKAGKTIIEKWQWVRSLAK